MQLRPLIDRSISSSEFCVFEMTGKLRRDRLLRVFNISFLTGWGDLINYWTSKFQFFIVLEKVLLFLCSESF